MHMPDYSLNVSAMVKLEQEQIIVCSLYMSSAKTQQRLLLLSVFFFLYSYKTRPLCLLQIFNIMAFHLLNLQIKRRLRLNCSVPWHGDCHHPVSAFLQRVI